MSRKILYLLPILAFLCSDIAQGQSSKFDGTWSGPLGLPGGTELRIVFHVTSSNGIVYTKADSPDQSAFGLECDTTIVTNNQILISMKSLNAKFQGMLENDSTLKGTFMQGMEFPLTLKRTSGNNSSSLKRPQTPKPPYPYKSEDVIYTNADNTLQYGATITIPEGKGPFPAAVLITGSGPQDRDETLAGHKPFAVLADYLSRKGYIILRVDDRGVGKSTGIFRESNSKDFATDVNNGVQYLLSRSEVDKKKIGLIGHSEGGMIAPIVAAERKDINFIVLLAGPGVPILELLTDQNVAVARSAGISEQTLSAFRPMYKSTLQLIIASKDSAEAVSKLVPFVEQWAAKTDKKILVELDFDTPEKRNENITSSVTEFLSPWFRYFLTFDPGPYLSKLKSQVLAINGEKDIQVLAEPNLKGIEAALKKGKSKSWEVHQIPGLNHLFQHCQACTVQEYSKIEETFAPEVLLLIGNWLDTHVK